MPQQLAVSDDVEEGAHRAPPHLQTCPLSSLKVQVSVGLYPCGGGEGFGMLGVCGAASDPLLVGSSCPFEGTREELAVHLENCRYEGLKEYLQRTDEHMVLMQDELKKKDEEIEFLKSMLARLSEKLETLDKTTNLRLGEGGEGGREGREEEEERKRGRRKGGEGGWECVREGRGERVHM